MTEILVLFEYPILNGGERSFLALHDLLAEDGFRFQAIAPPTGPLADALDQRNVKRWPLSYTTEGGVKRPLGELRDDLRSILTGAAPDLVHANSLATARLVGPVAAPLAIPSIGHVRDIVRLSRAAIADVNCHSRLLAVSSATREYHVQRGLIADKTYVALNGVDLDRFRPRPRTGWLHDELELDRNSQLVGNIGQITLRKGPEVFLAAAAAVAAVQTNVHFLMIGERHSNKDETCRLEQQLRRTASEPPLAGRVHFLGARDDIDLLLPELTMLVHAARQEPLGRVLIEAAACGLPIVATDVGGTTEILGRDNSAAQIVASDDVTSMAQAILAFAETPALRGKLGHAARQRATSHFDRREVARALADHYRAVLKQ